MHGCNIGKDWREGKKKKKEMEVESKFGAAILMPTSSTHKTYSLPPAEPGRFKITELTKMVR